MTMLMTQTADPFAALGLPPSRELSDRQVRRAWLKTALATNPDRYRAGDPAAYLAAWDAYQLLGTAMGRSAAYAGMRAGLTVLPVPAAAMTGPPPAVTLRERLLLFPVRIRYGTFARAFGRLGLCLVTARLALAFVHGAWLWTALAGLALIALFGNNDLAPLPRQPAVPAAPTGPPAALDAPAGRLAS
jgi:hypothetical protein